MWWFWCRVFLGVSPRGGDLGEGPENCRWWPVAFVAGGAVWAGDDRGWARVAVLMATASCTAYRAALESSGVVVGERVLVRRVGWLAALAQTMAALVVAERWTGAALSELASGKSGDGRVLPVKGWMAVRRLGWGCTAAVGVYVPERVRRIAEEEAARALRAGAHRRAVVAAVLSTWPVDPGRRSETE
jgi:hypothetical protein